MTADNGVKPSPETSMQVSDDENHAQTATINRIQQYRDAVAEYQLAFAEGELADHTSDDQRHRAYHQLARGFLQLLKPYLTDEEIPGSTYYWQGHEADELEDARNNEQPVLELGKISVDPPEAIKKPDRDEVSSALQRGHHQTVQRADPRNSVTGHEYPLVGLVDFAAAKPQWVEQWEVMFGPEVTADDLRQQIRDPTVTVQPRSHRHEPITVVKTMRVPRSIIDNAITALENFVRHLGMDVDLEAEPYMGEGGPGL